MWKRTCRTPGKATGSPEFCWGCINYINRIWVLISSSHSNVPHGSACLPSDTDGGLASTFSYFVVILYSASYSPGFRFKRVDNDVTSYFDQPRRLHFLIKIKVFQEAFSLLAKRINWFVCLWEWFEKLKPFEVIWAPLTFMESMIHILIFVRLFLLCLFIICFPFWQANATATRT